MASRSNKKDQRTEHPFCFSMQRDVKNRIFAGNFSIDNAKNLASLKGLHDSIPMSQLKYPILQSS